MDSARLHYRTATASDVPAMEEARAPDLEAGPADPRMAMYLNGEHQPQKALAPRVAYVAMGHTSIVGYIGGHQTRRLDCEGELQYLYVVPRLRRRGVGTDLLRHLARWFHEPGMRRVCVAVDEDNAEARAFLALHGAAELDESFLVWSDIAQVLPAPRRE